MLITFEDWNYEPVTALTFWVEWHQRLNDLMLPTYQIENVKAKDLFFMSGLEDQFSSTVERYEVPKDHNKRRHVKTFDWQVLYSLDPELAAKAWKLAHYFNYSYPDVDFDSLTCLDLVPTCKEVFDKPHPKCPPGTHPFPKDGRKIELLDDFPIDDLPVPSGAQGWVNVGCVEHKMEDGTIKGVSGVHKYITSKKK